MSNKWVYDVFFDYMILEQLYNESKKEIGEDKWKKDEEYLNVCETGFGFNTYTDKDGNTTETCDGFKEIDELVSKLTVRFVGVAQAFYTDTYY